VNNGKAWYGDSLRQILDGVSAKQAYAHPVPDAHSIWELLCHVESWVKFALGAVDGVPIPPWPAMPVELDWPAVTDTREPAWKQVVDSFFSHHLKLVIGAYKGHKADRIVAEVNNGGDLIEALLRTKSMDMAYMPVHASRGKLTRAEPVAALYEQHRVHHLGAFGMLEDQLCDYVPMASRSPDRMDALVWAITALSTEVEQEIIYEYDELHSISPDLDRAESVLDAWARKPW
jgi:hypothetical protein